VNRGKGRAELSRSRTKHNKSTLKYQEKREKRKKVTIGSGKVEEQLSQMTPQPTGKNKGGK